ncbi:ubiquitin [Ruminococcaceae bacterium OttesenSCG-928-L11]|nr:ubiquitin [Ruminococcaceae bacterium OttesenSCG-928-L11]
MADLELVEKLRQLASVTYDEAREALDNCDNDLLEAVIYLEKRGKVPPPTGGGKFSSKEEPGPKTGYSGYSTYISGPTHTSHGSFGATLRRLVDWLIKLFNKSLTNVFEVKRHDSVVFTLPVIVLIILACAVFWPTVSLLILGLFFDFRYSFRGPEKPSGNSSINDLLEEIEKAADSLKSEITGKD